MSSIVFLCVLTNVIAFPFIADFAIALFDGEIEHIKVKHLFLLFFLPALVLLWVVNFFINVFNREKPRNVLEKAFSKVRAIWNKDLF